MYCFIYLDRNEPIMTNRPFYVFQFKFSFGIDVTSSCTKFGLYRKATSVNKTSVILLSYVNTNNIVGIKNK